MQTTPQTVADLEALLSDPYDEDIEFLKRVKGDVVVLGAGGKMGPTLVARLVRAAEGDGRTIYAVARHGEFPGAKVIRADLSNRADVNSLLPDAPNVIYLVGRKFGSTGAAHLTWSTNVLVPSLVCERYAPLGSRVVALSTGNVYPFTPRDSGGPDESHALAPVGEYAWSALARERMFEYFSREHGLPVAIIRLNYAVELRYGTLVDIAQKVLSGEPVDLAMGYFNCIWQGDANSMCIRALEHCSSPPQVFNLTGLETLSVRAVAELFGKRFGVKPLLTGVEAETALLSNARKYAAVFGEPRISVEQMVEWIAEWLQRGGATHGKPTHFEVRSGQF